MDDLLDTGVGLKEPGHCQAILHVLLHPQGQGLQRPVHQVTVEGRWNGANGILEETELLVQVISGQGC